MLKSILALSLLATPLAVADVPSPAYYLKVLADSKLMYGMEENGVKNPADLMTCPAPSTERHATSDAMSPKGHLSAANEHIAAGRINEAREELVKALVADPSLGAALDTLEKKPETYGVNALVRHRFEPPQGLIGVKRGDMVVMSGGPDNGWLGYALCKAVWMNEPNYRAQQGVKKDEWSLAEERACVTNQVLSSINMTRSKLEEKTKGVKDADVVAALPEPVGYIRDVMSKKMLDGYILFEVVGQRCPEMIASLDDASRAELEKYVRAFVVVPRAADSH